MSDSNVMLGTMVDLGANRSMEESVAEASASADSAKASADSAKASADSAKDSASKAMSTTPSGYNDLVNQVNNIEEGVFNSDQITGELLRVLLLQSDEVDSLKGETLNLKLKNTQTYPFNNSKTTVQLSKYRANKDYTIYIEVQSVTGGAVGDFVISDKMLNGFKLEYTGSASSVDVSIHVRGGI